MHKETIPIVKSLLISLNWNHEKAESYNYLKQKKKIFERTQLSKMSGILPTQDKKSCHDDNTC
jgi:hypothetical protein